MEPITFAPLYMQRIWGGRKLETIYRRSLPDPQAPFGESWEIVDRENEQSIVDHGPLSGTSLGELWNTRREEIFGRNLPSHRRFPILVKVLDAREDLSLQVHPPIHLAEVLGGEPKTEMWYIADCDPGGRLYVGLKNGVNRNAFERALADGTAADLVHVLTPRSGDSIFIPSGRLHAIGAGFLIHEIQQNSDTTYRVFDWNRLGLDGKPRDLHLGESLASIDFTDFEPAMDPPVGENLASCAHFQTDCRKLTPGQTISNLSDDDFSILSVADGQLRSAGDRVFHKGSFLLLPRQAHHLTAVENSTILQITLPR